MLRSLKRAFFDKWYKFFPPPMVGYWKRAGGSARAKVVTAKDGSYAMQIEGEKELYPGFPRGHVLTGPLAGLKHKIKNMVFNQVFAELEKMAGGMKYDMIPPEKMVPAVRELHRVLQELEDAEIVIDMKARIRLIKTVLTFFLTEDDAYRMRWQWCMERFNIKKVRLSKADRYFFRGKYFRVDHDHYSY